MPRRNRRRSGAIRFDHVGVDPAQPGNGKRDRDDVHSVSQGAGCSLVAHPCTLSLTTKSTSSTTGRWRVLQSDRPSPPQLDHLVQSMASMVRAALPAPLRWHPRTRSRAPLQPDGLGDHVTEARPFAGHAEGGRFAGGNWPGGAWRATSPTIEQALNKVLGKTGDEQIDLSDWVGPTATTMLGVFAGKAVGGGLGGFSAGCSVVPPAACPRRHARQVQGCRGRATGSLAGVHRGEPADRCRHGGAGSGTETIDQIAKRPGSPGRR